MPKITDEFHAIDDIGWYTAAYLLTTSTFQLVHGKLYTFFSTKVVFIIVLCIFEVGSIICAAAPNSTTLIVGRAIAGLGAGGMFPGATLILVYSAPLERRPALLGIVTGMSAVASLAGPFIGGVFADRVTWRWCFIINIPLGVVAVIVVFFFVKTPVDASYRTWSIAKKFSEVKLPEMLVVAASLVCLILALQWGGSIYPWSDGRVIALLVVFAVLLALFIASQVYFSNSRAVPDSILRERSIWSAAVFAICMAGAMFISVTYLPIYFQAIKGSSALSSGINVMPLILGFLIMTTLSGVITNITGYCNISLIICPILSSIGAGLITTFAVDTPSREWIGYQALLGFGVGFGLQQPLIVAQSVLREQDVPFGIALMTLSQMLGGAVFVAVAQNVFQNDLVNGIVAAIPGFDSSQLLNEGATSFSTLFTPEQIKLVLPIYNNVINAVFRIVAGLCAASIIGALGTEWRSTKKKAATPTVKTETVIDM